MKTEDNYENIPLSASKSRTDQGNDRSCGQALPVGRNIRRLRMERNMTQRELAWHLRVSVQAVSKWERGYTYPDLSLLLPIARLFSVSLDELFGREDVG